ncbi:uncharacterized protein HKW66_Vig0038630 [Vigna angularis]|uniref:Uncharacterized protein n=1 Tax=Phaseolus angularis TaxID=3914 RepID=A0A8T0LC04_PHAAN|nr:uncharacterized protein HKW66_Vig0038630 [Vigna angularis]
MFLWNVVVFMQTRSLVEEQVVACRNGKKKDTFEGVRRGSGRKYANGVLLLSKSSLVLLLGSTREMRMKNNEEVQAVTHKCPNAATTSRLITFVSKDFIQKLAAGNNPVEELTPLAELHNEVNDIVVLTGFAEWHDSGTLGKVAHDGNLAADILDVDSRPELPEQPRLEMLLQASSSCVSRSMQSEDRDRRLLFDSLSPVTALAMVVCVGEARFDILAGHGGRDLQQFPMVGGAEIAAKGRVSEEMVDEACYRFTS